ncbi:MAG: WbqC family protein [Deltaproteobacteria bacterium]
MNCVVLQPSYIPWRGVFEQIKRADIFVFYDDVQYDKHGFRNRNQIKTPNGKLWLTIPVRCRGNLIERTPIHDIEIVWNTSWPQRHLASHRQSYSKAPYFRRYAPLLEEFYSRRDRLLADFTIDFTIALARELGFTKTKFLRSSELGLPFDGTATDRLLTLLKNLGATYYISGPSARGYVEEEKFLHEGIPLEYMHYDYVEYPQLHPPYDPFVSVLDLLFMTGPDAARYICQRSDANARPTADPIIL